MLLTYHSDDTHAKALSSDSPLKVSGAIVCDSLMTVICVCVCVCPRLGFRRPQT